MDVKDDTTRTDHCKIYNLFFAWLRTQMVRLGKRIFAATDTRARHHGWEITATQAGLGRRYRDPRFDTLAPCCRCQGRGANPSGSACQTCNGTGRIHFDPPAEPARRRSA